MSSFHHSFKYILFFFLFIFFIAGGILLLLLFPMQEPNAVTYPEEKYAFETGDSSFEVFKSKQRQPVQFVFRIRDSAFLIPQQPNDLSTCTITATMLPSGKQQSIDFLSGFDRSAVLTDKHVTSILLTPSNIEGFESFDSTCVVEYFETTGTPNTRPAIDLPF
ncbi:hypothetical protein [Bacillus solimangrovi]|uniref:Uncharacterized protein n=1 Tax=Bacillus solimangrovi TaxID=1305675 RepID=A0A1E5LD87_9BACI|nr:hypothetical protein [Bacillus solimangrovi]OEH92045.1 hypothetical protein BFG57_17145 [Bacillus solimangrovi]